MFHLAGLRGLTPFSVEQLQVVDFVSPIQYPHHITIVPTVHVDQLNRLSSLQTLIANLADVAYRLYLYIYIFSATLVPVRLPTNFHVIFTCKIMIHPSI